MGDRERDRSGGLTPISPMNASTTTLSLSGSSHALLEEERWLLGEGLTHGELRDEIYCQVMKQLNSLATLRSDVQPAPRRSRGLFGGMFE